MDKLGYHISRGADNIVVQHLIMPTFKFYSKYHYRGAEMANEGKEVNFFCWCAAAGHLGWKVAIALYKNLIPRL